MGINNQFIAQHNENNNVKFMELGAKVEYEKRTISANPFKEIVGIGEGTTKKLLDAGINSTAELLKKTDDELYDILRNKITTYMIKRYKNNINK